MEIVRNCSKPMSLLQKPLKHHKYNQAKHLKTALVYTNTTLTTNLTLKKGRRER